jgi:hypothetical protein
MEFPVEIVCLIKRYLSIVDMYNTFKACKGLSSFYPTYEDRIERLPYESVQLSFWLREMKLISLGEYEEILIWHNPNLSDNFEVKERANSLFQFASDSLNLRMMFKYSRFVKGRIDDIERCRIIHSGSFLNNYKYDLFRHTLYSSLSNSDKDYLVSIGNIEALYIERGNSQLEPIEEKVESRLLRYTKVISMRYSVYDFVYACQSNNREIIDHVFHNYRSGGKKYLVEFNNSDIETVAGCKLLNYEDIVIISSVFNIPILKALLIGKRYDYIETHILNTPLSYIDICDILLYPPPSFLFIKMVPKGRIYSNLYFFYRSQRDLKVIKEELSYMNHLELSLVE